MIHTAVSRNVRDIVPRYVQSSARLLNRWIDPFIPARFTLFWCLAHKQGRDTRPLIFAVFHDRCFQDFVLRIFPHPAFYHNSNHPRPAISSSYVSQIMIRLVVNAMRCIQTSNEKTRCLSKRTNHPKNRSMSHVIKFNT